MKTGFLASCVAAGLLAFLTPPVHAQSGAAARAAVELTETLLRQGGREAAERGARELAEFGGARAVREALEHAEREGGEALVSRVAGHTRRHGVLALQALKDAPGPVIRALDDVPAELTANSLRALAREPRAMREMATEFGGAALETAAKHPGLAAPIARRLGGEGLDVARRLSTDEAVLLSRAADDLAKLPAAERATFLQMIRRSPAKTLAWMERHPRLLIAGSATTAVVLAKKEIFGEGAQQGLLERAAGALYKTFEKPVNAALGVAAALILAWIALKARAVSRFLKGRRKATV